MANPSQTLAEALLGPGVVSAQDPTAAAIVALLRKKKAEEEAVARAAAVRAANMELQTGQSGEGLTGVKGVEGSLLQTMVPLLGGEKNFSRRVDQKVREGSFTAGQTFQPSPLWPALGGKLDEAGEAISNWIEEADLLRPWRPPWTSLEAEAAAEGPPDLRGLTQPRSPEGLAATMLALGGRGFATEGNDEAPVDLSFSGKGVAPRPARTDPVIPSIVPNLLPVQDLLSTLPSGDYAPAIKTGQDVPLPDFDKMREALSAVPKADRTERILALIAGAGQGARGANSVGEFLMGAGGGAAQSLVEQLGSERKDEHALAQLRAALELRAAQDPTALAKAQLVSGTQSAAAADVRPFERGKLLAGNKERQEINAAAVYNANQESLASRSRENHLEDLAQWTREFPHVDVNAQGITYSKLEPNGTYTVKHKPTPHGSALAQQLRAHAIVLKTQQEVEQKPAAIRARLSAYMGNKDPRMVAKVRSAALDARRYAAVVFRGLDPKATEAAIGDAMRQLSGSELLQFMSLIEGTTVGILDGFFPPFEGKVDMKTEAAKKLGLPTAVD